MTGDTDGTVGDRAGDEPRDAERGRGEEPFDPAQALAVIAAGRRSAFAAYPSGTFLFSLWGTVWLVGYGLMWLSANEDGTPSGLAASA